MAYSMWVNADGLVVKNHGAYDSNPANYINRARALNTLGAVKTLVMDFDLELVGASATWFPVDITNNGTNDGFSEEEPFIPSGSAVISCNAYCKEIAAGGTEFTLGTFTKAGATTDIDGLINATNGAIANMGAIGERIIGTGDQMADATGDVGLASDCYLAITTTGTYTAGKGTIVIEYIPPVLW